MHPDNAFRTDDRELMEALVEEIGFGMIFTTTPDGPRVAHTPLLWTGDGAVQFHLSRGNALTKHIDGTTILAVVNGPDAYVSPRWYREAEQVPTWNYVSLEMEGRCRRMDSEGLTALLETLADREEARIPRGNAWTMAEVPRPKLRGMLAGIVGFELEVRAWRPTFKLSQNKATDERLRVAEALDVHGAPALAQLMRKLIS